MISIGCILDGPPGPEMTPTSRLAFDTLRLINKHCGDGALDAGMPAVNIIFQISGPIVEFYSEPEFAVGRFFRKKKVVVVAVNVPAAQVKSSGSVKYIIWAMRQAIEIAAGVFEKRSDERLDVEKANKIIDLVAVELLKMNPNCP